MELQRTTGKRPRYAPRDACPLCRNRISGRSDHGASFCGCCLELASQIKNGAARIVQKAIRAGGLQPASDFTCTDCGEPAACYDHRDYEQPLLVEAVCRGCNIRRGPGLYPPPNVLLRRLLTERR